MSAATCLMDLVPPAPTARIAPRDRLASVDIVRGAVMVLMALDHVREFVTNQRFQPEDLTRASVALFATRWVTHFCAPSFFLLAGLGIGLAMNRGKTAADMSRFLAVRGVWLMILDLTISDFGWGFSLHMAPVFAVVIWTLGLSMLCMAALVRIPRAAVLTLSLALIALHNLFDAVQPAQLGALAPAWILLHVPGFLVPGTFLSTYPLVPWVGVMGAGYVLASVYQWEPARRRSFLLWTGLAATALFVVLRATHSYGNPLLWTPQRTPELTAAAFFNVRKYPPSLQFLLMTLGPALVALSLAESARGRIADWVVTYGRVPLFYYCVHIYVGHVLAIALAAVQVGGLHRINILTEVDKLPAGYGVGLPGVYATWITVVVIMYFACRWFAELKATRSWWWLRYA
ncbi:MAG TPA: heparan-alpha-glucosaminide N-acetyltransferase domain-containing protein [Gemmatimonadaceae bacterium]